MDQNEIDADAAIAALTSRCRSKRIDSDSADCSKYIIAATTSRMIDQNESDADAAIAALQAGCRWK